MRDLTKIMTVMNLKSISEVVENAVYANFIREHTTILKDLDEVFEGVFPVDKKIVYNSGDYYLIGVYEVHGQIIKGTAYCNNVYFNLGVYDESDLITDKFNEPEMEKHLVMYFNQLLSN